MPKGEKLTVKQRKFIKKYIETKGNGTQAALEAYDTDKPNVANAIAVENLQKPTVKEAIEQALIKLGLTPEWILDKHKKIATSQIIETESGKTIIKDGMVAERALENLGKIANLYPSNKTELDLSDGKLHISWED